MRRQLAHQRLQELAGRQHDVVTYAQLIALGLGPSAIQHMVRTGRLHPHHRGVYAVGRPRLDRYGVWMAAVLACGPGAVLSHLSAGALRGLVRGDGSTVHVTVRGRAGRASRAGIRVHRTLMQPVEADTVDAIAVTSWARTVLDLSVGASLPRIRRLIDRSEQLRVYDHVPLLACLVAHPRHPGAARLRAALEHHAEPAATKNALELAMLDLCRRGGLPGPRVNTPVAGFEADFFWPEHRLIVETDGRETHLTRASFEADRARDAHHTSLGYRVVRFTYTQVLRDSTYVAGILQRML